MVFDVLEVHHALLAAILNDYFNIAVRNECFCAQPYVREMLLEELWDLDVGEYTSIENMAHMNFGMVRVSIGLYNTEEDVDVFLKTLRTITAERDEFIQQYQQIIPGEYVHGMFTPRAESLFDPRAVLDAFLRERSENSPGLDGLSAATADAS